MSVYVTDTHPVIWYTLNKRSNLSPKALNIFESAERGEMFIYVPVIVLWEVAILEKANRIQLYGNFIHWAEKLLSYKGFDIAPLEPEIIALGTGYNFNADPFDKIITAYANHLDLPLITKDVAISNSGLIEIYW